jgi:hypothetical protein
MEKRFSRNPELEIENLKQPKKIARSTYALGMETGVTKTGVVGILKEENQDQL